MTLLTDRFLMDSMVPEQVVLLRPAVPAPALVGAVSWLRSAYMTKTARSFINCYKRKVSVNRDDQCYLASDWL